MSWENATMCAWVSNVAWMKEFGWRSHWEAMWNSGNYSSVSHRSRKRSLGYVNDDGGMYLERKHITKS